MVSVTSNLPPGDTVTTEAVEHWLQRIGPGRTEGELRALRKACNWVLENGPNQADQESDNRVRHAIEVADILANLRLDQETLVAAILQDRLRQDRLSDEHLVEEFGPGVAGMVQDLAHIASLSVNHALDLGVGESQHIENLRRMLLGISKDVRVVMVVLAQRLHKMRALKHTPVDLRQPIARETLDIYAPLANRLGIWQMKWELEDLSLRYLEPETYQRIARLLDGSRKGREDFIAGVIQLLHERFEAVGIHADITGRPKHIYSIWRKMRRKDLEFQEIFDIRAVRVLVREVADCYAALGIVHGLWKHIPGEFDDYIATPKSNLYQSLHTAVIGPQGKTLEIQIRTRDMHEHAELGVAAHWRYKENRGQDADFERRIGWLRYWLDTKENLADAENFGERLKQEFQLTRIYVLTPRGQVIELPHGATALDFAYAIHTDVGHRCRGARVDGRIAPLTQPLHSGQQVEILTTKEGGPSRDWLSPHLGYLKTTKARNRVRQWFKQQDFDQNVATGKLILEKEFNRLGIERPDLDAVARHFNLKKSDELLAAIGRGEISPVQAAGVVARESKPAMQRPIRSTSAAKHKPSSPAEVMVEGVSDLMTHMARCCKPVPFDRITGYITRGHGVTVHRADCATIKRLSGADRERLVHVVWSEPGKDNRYAVDIQVLAADRQGLLRDITSILANESVDVTAVNTFSDRKKDSASMRFTVEIHDIRQLSRVLDKVAQIPEVIEVRRRI